MRDIVVVGSVALDSVRTLEGESREALGGSAVFFSLAARHFARVRLVGVVGEDFPVEHREMLASRGIDLRGLQTLPGRTFRWVGRFGRDVNEARTLDTQLNVFESFRPVLGAEARKARALFLANIDPDLQAEVLDQMPGPRLTVCDTMDFWIVKKRRSLAGLLRRVGIFLVNEGEARRLSGERNAVRCAEALAGMGPGVVVIKRGEHGSLLYSRGRACALPAYPVRDVKDPTGAGDSFAGAFLGSLLAGGGDPSDFGALRRAAAYGTVAASFTVCDFSTRSIESLRKRDIDERWKEYADSLALGPARAVGA
jgi:sugar/nucleoside kinase (ribokinase family)